MTTGNDDFLKWVQDEPDLQGCNITRVSAIALLVKYGGDCFGVCTVCGNCDGCVNLHRNHWFYCDKHKQRWCVGNNLFSSWQDETEEDWKRNWEHIGGYAEPQDAMNETTSVRVPVSVSGDDIPF